jgi:ketosteroid isomerase-like protein
MSRENVEAFKRGIAAFNRGDGDALLEEFDATMEWHLSLPMMLGGESSVFRGHEAGREWLRELFDAFAEVRVEISDIRDLGERIVALGDIRGRGKQSGVAFESPVGYLVAYRNGKGVRMDDFLDLEEALEAAGLR